MIATLTLSIVYISYLIPPEDKFLHFGVICALFLSCRALGVSVLLTLSLCTVISVGKEIYDYFDYGLFSFSDIVADYVGGILAHIVTKSTVWNNQFEEGDQE